MTKTRSYGEGCAAAHALDLVGERWALLVVRELLLGPKRFTDIRAGIPHASPNVLSQRLRDLEDALVVTRRKLPPPASVKVYELTDWGRDLEPVIIALGSWGVHSPAFPRDAGIGTTSIVLALRTMYDPSKLKGFEGRFELRIGEDRFRLAVTDGKFEAMRGEQSDADAVLTTNPDTLASLMGGRPLSDAIAAGEIEIEGPVKKVERLISLFPLPEPVAA